MANPPRWQIHQPHKSDLWGLNDDDLLGGLLPGNQDGTAVVYGGFGSFKSTIVAAFIGSQLNEAPFLGMPSETIAADHTTAAWLALEDGAGTKKRFAGWAALNNWHRVPDVVSGRFNVRDASERAALVGALLSRPGFEGNAATGGYTHLVIDTAQRAGGAAFDPLDAAQVSPLCDGVEALREKLEARWALLITHSGKDSGAGIRGSSAWYDGPALVLRVERVGKSLTGRIVVEKDRHHGREGQSFGFRVNFVDVCDPPGDEHARAAIPIVSAHASAKAPISNAVRHKSALLEIVAAAAPEGRPVVLAEVRKQFGRVLAEQGVDARHQGTRFKEALNTLVTAGTLKVTGDRIVAAAPVLAADD